MHGLLPLRLAAWRSRRLIRVLVIALLVGLAVRLAAPPAPATSRVVVTARAVPAGELLSAQDLRVVRLPSSAVPSTTVSGIETVLGRRAAVELPAGLALVPSLVDGDRFAVDPPAGTVVVPLTLGGASSLRLGDSVEVVADVGCTAQGDQLAVVARVVGLGSAGGGTSPGADGTSAGLLGSGLAIGSSGSTAQDSTTLIAVTPESGRRIAGILANCRVSAVIVP